MKEPSASQLGLAAACGHPFTSGLRWPEEEKRDWNLFGDRVHAGIDAAWNGYAALPALLHGLDEQQRRAFFRCVEHALEHLKMLGTWRPELDVRLETVLRYDVNEGAARVAASRFERKAPGVWTSIVDAFIVDRVARRAVVVDWKTGRQSALEPAAQNWQMRLSAVAVARIYRVREVRVELVLLDEDGARVDAATFDALELGQIARDLRALRRSLTGGPTPPVPGVHCTQKFCKLVGICAATQSALATAQPVGDRFSVQIRDEEHARWTLERLPGAKAALEAVERAVNEYARTRPVHLADGKVYGWRERTEREVNIDTPEREAALRRELGVFADLAIKRETSTSLEAIEEAARQAAEAAGEKRTIRKRVNAALAALEAAGGLTVSTYPKCEAFKPKET